MRLIDADALRDKIHYTDDFYETPYIDYDDILEAPTIEPKRGEWLPDENGDFRCTNCGRIAEWEFFEDNFCPNCGADMKGADDEMR